jgi:3-oxoadipate enol-lactonase
VLKAAGALGIDDFDLAGCSIGARVALDVARAAPARVRSLLLACPGLGCVEPAAAIEALWTREEESLGAGDFDAATEITLAMWISGPDRRLEELDPSFVEQAREMALQCNRRETGATSGPRFAEPPVHEVLELVVVPTLVIRAAHDQPHIGEVCTIAASRIPRARLVTMDTGHLPNLERPEEFDSLFLAHLASAQGGGQDTQQRRPALARQWHEARHRGESASRDRRQ